MELEDIHKKLLADCAYDDMGLWVVVSYVSDDAFSDDSMPEWVRQKTLEVIRFLLQKGLIEAGNFEHEDSGGYRFQPMLLPVDKVINYIEREWDELGRAPNIGDICWFRATPAGKKLAGELGLKA